MRPNRSHSRRRLIHTLLREHFDAYLAENPNIPGSHVAFHYKGMTRQELEDAIQASRHTTLLDLQQLASQGLVQPKGHGCARSYRLRLDKLGNPQDELYQLTTANSCPAPAPAKPGHALSRLKPAGTARPDAQTMPPEIQHLIDLGLIETLAKLLAVLAPLAAGRSQQSRRSSRPTATCSSPQRKKLSH